MYIKKNICLYISGEDNNSVQWKALSSMATAYRRDESNIYEEIDVGANSMFPRGAVLTVHFERLIQSILILVAFFLETNNNIGAEKMFQTPTGSIPIITRNRVFESSSHDSQSRPMSADPTLIAASFPSATSSPTLVEQTHLLNFAQQNTKLV